MERLARDLDEDRLSERGRIAATSLARDTVAAKRQWNRGGQPGEASALGSIAKALREQGGGEVTLEVQPAPDAIEVSAESRGGRPEIKPPPRKGDPPALEGSESP